MTSRNKNEIHLELRENIHSLPQIDPHYSGAHFLSQIAEPVTYRSNRFGGKEREIRIDCLS